MGAPAEVQLADVARDGFALLVYPGALLAVVIGIMAELGVSVVIGRSGGAVRAWLGALRAGADSLRAGELPLLLGGLLVALAATQLAIPFDAIPPAERNLLVAAIALAAATWLGWGWRWAEAGSRHVLLAQVCWLVAVLAPALVFERLRPTALSAVAVPGLLPVKIAAAALYLVCLPALLQLLPGRGEPPAPPVRILLWLPLCGLFTSLILPPAPEDLAGLGRFLGVTLAVAAVAIVTGAAVGALDQRARVIYSRLAWVGAAAVLAIAAVTSILE